MNILLGAVLAGLAVGLWGLLHSLLARSGAKNWARRIVGPAGDRGYRLFYNVVAVLTLLPVLAIPTRFPGVTLYQIPVPLVTLTTFLQLLSVLAIVGALLQTDISSFIGVRQLARSQGSREAVLRVSGLYGWVRHPLYLAGLVIIWLVPVMTSSILALNAGLTAYIYIGSRFEERHLAREFGEAYSGYKQSVPALLPRPWRRR